MSGEEHVVGLHRGADEETRQGNNGQAEAAGEILVREGVGVVVLCKDVEEASVDGGLDEVEFRDVGVLHPVDKHFGAEHEKKGAHYLAGPEGEDGERLREDGGADERSGVVVAQAKAAGFNDVARGDDREHEPELEAFDDVGAR